jgi:hypothetical protein
MVIQTCWETKFINYILLWKNTEAGCWLHQTQFQNEDRERLWTVTIDRLVYMQESDENSWGHHFEKFKTANRRHYWRQQTKFVLLKIEIEFEPNGDVFSTQAWLKIGGIYWHPKVSKGIIDSSIIFLLWRCLGKILGPLYLEPGRRKRLISGTDLARVGLAESLSRLSRLDQLTQMPEQTSLLCSSRRADRKTYMVHLISPHRHT